MEGPNFVKQSWKEAYDAGHEIGVHTHSHPHGRDFSIGKWEKEMQQCIDMLTQTDGLSIPRNELIFQYSKFSRLSILNHGNTGATESTE